VPSYQIQIINLLYFAWELMWPEPKFTGLRSLGFSGNGALLHSDWLPPNHVITYYHKFELISTLLAALAGARRRLSMKMNDFRPL